MSYAKYEITKAGITKDGHTMFEQDIVKDLNRKSFLEAERNSILAAEQSVKLHKQHRESK